MELNDRCGQCRHQNYCERSFVFQRHTCMAPMHDGKANKVGSVVTCMGAVLLILSVQYARQEHFFACLMPLSKTMGPLVLWWDERIMRAQTRAARRTATHSPWNLVVKTFCGPDLDERWTISNLQPNERRGMRTGTSINVCTSQDFGHSLPHHCRDKQTRLTI